MTVAATTDGDDEGDGADDAFKALVFLFLMECFYTSEGNFFFLLYFIFQMRFLSLGIFS